MRKWIKLFEAQAKTKTQTKSGIDIDIEIAPDSQGDLAVPGEKKDQNVSVPGKAAGGAKTRASINADMPPEAGAHFANLANMDLEDEISDEEAAQIAGHDDVEFVDTTARPEPVTPENLPMVIRQDMMAHGDSEFDPAEFNPEWHQVKHLPGYIQAGIRAIGRMVFRPFTETPIEEIQVLSTLSNPEKDVRKMMSWISRNGIRDDDANLNFTEAMPGYEADVKVYSTEDAQFMLVKDFAGYYIYGWPGGRGVHLDGPEDMARLESLWFDEDALRESFEKFMTEGEDIEILDRNGRRLTPGCRVRYRLPDYGVNTKEGTGTIVSFNQYGGVYYDADVPEPARMDGSGGYREKRTRQLANSTFQRDGAMQGHRAMLGSLGDPFEHGTTTTFMEIIDCPDEKGDDALNIAVDALVSIAWNGEANPDAVAQKALDDIGGADINDEVVEKALNRIAFEANTMGSVEEAEQIARDAIAHLDL